LFIIIFNQLQHIFQLINCPKNYELINETGKPRKALTTT